MIVFPNAKINIGLNVLSKRTDGFHNIESLFYPIQLCDVLEIVEASDFAFTQSGISFDACSEDNLVVKAFRMLQTRFSLPNIHIHLHKQIPVGAGLGGGSSDAAYMLCLLNDFFKLKLSASQLRTHALELGSDCPFFVDNIPAIAHGRGEILTPFHVNLAPWFLVLVKPDIFVSTAEAYAGITPVIPSETLSSMLEQPVRVWKQNVHNQFEQHVFQRYHEIEVLKTKMYSNGAVYASMSGSGSSVFGLFQSKPDNIEDVFRGNFIHTEVLK